MGFEGSSRFEVVGKLGEGGMGIVYEAYDHQRGIYVALKTLRRMDPASLYRFKREFRAVSDLSHPNIVALYELVADDDEWFFTMELVRGASLIDYLRSSHAERHTPRTPGAGRGLGGVTATTHSLADVPAEDEIAVDEGAPIRHVSELVDLRKLRATMSQLASALHELHGAGMVHRDLKPSNVRVTEDGQVLLMDFGIVAESGAPEAPGHGPALGTPYYMAPEQILGERATAATDWYAFGVILHLALTGQLPFRGTRKQVLSAKQRSDPPPIDRLVHGVPDELIALCRRLLSRRPRRRPGGVEVLAALGKAEGTDPSLFVGTTARSFIGRDAELEVLRHAYEAATKGEAVSVFVEGEGGMGKSALVSAFLGELEQARGRPTPYVLSGRCHQRERLAFKAFDGVIDSLTKVLTTIPERRARDMLPENVGLLARLFPVLRAVPGIELPSRPVGTPQLARSRAFEALRSLLTRLAALKTVVLYIDDLHWADGDSLELLVELSRAPAPAPMLLLASLRSEEIIAGSALDRAVETVSSRYHGRQIALGPLSSAEQEALVFDILGDQASPLTLDEAFWSESEGNPLFLVELARHAKESGGAVPTRVGLRDLLTHRIQTLSAEARQMVEVIGVNGAPMPLRVASEAAGVPADRSDRAATSLHSASLIRSTVRDEDRWLTPYNQHIRDGVLALLSDNERRQRHEHIARALEAWEDAPPEDLARHWTAAGHPRRAERHLIVAAEAAIDHLAFDHAVVLLRSVVEQTPEPDGELLRKLGTALALAGKSFEAAEAFERAASLVPQHEALELERLAADNLLRSGHIERGLERVGSVLRRLGAPFAPTRARAALSLVWHRARIAIRGHDYTARPPEEIDERMATRLDTLYAAAAGLGMIDHIRGAAAQSRHLLDAFELGDEHRICRALAIECAYLVAPGGRGAVRADELGERVIETARRLGDPYLIAVAQLARGGTFYFRGTPNRAREALIECDERLQGSPVSAQWERVTARYFLALAQLAAGDFAGAERTTRRSLLEAERNRDVYARAMFQCIPNTWLLLCADRPEDATASLETAVQGWPESTFYIAHYVQVFSRALVSIYEGDGAAALGVIDDAMADIRRLLLTRMPYVMGEIHTLRARAGLLMGDERPVKKAIRHLTSTNMDYTAGVASVLRAALRMRKDAQGEAAEELARAASILEEAGASHLAAAARARHGELIESPKDRAAGLESMARNGISAPERMLDALCPGFGS